MQVIFLGTGPSQAIPRKGHRDALCRDARQGGKSRRTRSAALVTTEKTHILIDAGPDIPQQLKKNKPDRIDAVLITHGHEDAVGGLKDLDAWLDDKRLPLHPPLRKEGNPDAHRGGRINVYTDKLTAERLIRRFGAFKNLRFVALKDYVKIIVGDMKIIPVPVLHTRDVRQIKTYGYLFESFCYASDFYDLPERTKSLFKNLKTLILDGAMYMGIKMPTHMSADATVRLAAELRARRLVLTQTGHAYPPHDQAERAIRRYAQTLDSTYPKTIYLAFDGMHITV